MKTEYCMRICPYCDGNGLLRAVKDERGVFISCDECYQKFLTPQEIPVKKSYLSLSNDIEVDLSEAVEQGWAEYIYVFENGKWLKYTDKTKSLF